MCYWRGAWNLMDLYLTEAWLNSVIIMVVCQIFTFATRTSRNNVGLPVSIPMLDTDDDLLAPDTALKASVSTTSLNTVSLQANFSIWEKIIIDCNIKLVFLV